MGTHLRIARGRSAAGTRKSRKEIKSKILKFVSFRFQFTGTKSFFQTIKNEECTISVRKESSKNRLTLKTVDRLKILCVNEKYTTTHTGRNVTSYLASKNLSEFRILVLRFWCYNIQLFFSFTIN